MSSQNGILAGKRAVWMIAPKNSTLEAEETLYHGTHTLSVGWSCNCTLQDVRETLKRRGGRTHSSAILVPTFKLLWDTLKWRVVRFAIQDQVREQTLTSDPSVGKMSMIGCKEGAEAEATQRHVATRDVQLHFLVPPKGNTP